jgi:hypothetical protein
LSVYKQKSAETRGRTSAPYFNSRTLPCGRVSAKYSQAETRPQGSVADAQLLFFSLQNFLPFPINFQLQNIRARIVSGDVEVLAFFADFLVVDFGDDEFLCRAE